MAEEPEVTLATVAEGLAKLNEVVGTLPTQQDIDGIKSGFQSNLDSLKNDVTTIAGKSTSSTETGKTQAEVAARLSEEQVEKKIQDAVSANNDWHEAKNEASSKGIPADLLEGLTTASEIKRVVAIADFARGGEKKEEKSSGSDNAGTGGTQSQEPLKGLAAIASYLEDQ